MVLKVEVGAGWRKVGCGGRGIVDAVTLIIICTAFDGTQYNPPNLRYLRVNGVELYNTISGVFTGSDAPGGTFSLHITDPHSGGSFFWGLADPIAAVGVPPEGIPHRGGDGASGGWSGPLTGTIISNQQWPRPDVIDPIPGRLRMQLPDGSWVREACDDDDLTQVVLADNANRADGASVVLNRSDGGLWSNPDGTWVIQSNELYRTTWGITTITNDWLAADYDAHGLITITLSLRQPNPYQFQRIFFAKESLSGGGGNGYQISIRQYENWLALSREGADNAQVWGTSFAGPHWEDGGAAEHVMVITFDEVTRHITMNFDGVPFINYTDPLHHPVGSVLGLFADSRASQTFDNVSVTGVPNGHPLKIEDPANPGTWITVACMVPASDFALYGRARYDTATYD